MMKKYYAIRLCESDDEDKAIEGYLHTETAAVSRQDLIDKPLVPQGCLDLKDAHLFDARSTAQEIMASLQKHDSGILSTKAYTSRSMFIVEVIIEVDGTRRLAE